jgi:hypothetical protein
MSSRTARFCGFFRDGHPAGLCGAQGLGALSLAAPPLIVAIAFGVVGAGRAAPGARTVRPIWGVQGVNSPEGKGLSLL